MSYTTLPIVGAFYRPPAQVILANLPVGTPLTLFAEPDNEHDPNAIAVFIEGADINDTAAAAMQEGLADIGLSINDLQEKGYWHLGYIPKNFAAELKSAATIVNDVPYEAEFAVGNDGKPRVKFPIPIL